MSLGLYSSGACRTDVFQSKSLEMERERNEQTQGSGITVPPTEIQIRLFQVP